MLGAAWDRGFFDELEGVGGGGEVEDRGDAGLATSTGGGAGGGGSFSLNGSSRP